jgi:hypothetical protein
MPPGELMPPSDLARILPAVTGLNSWRNFYIATEPIHESILQRLPGPLARNIRAGALILGLSGSSRGAARTGSLESLQSFAFIANSAAKFQEIWPFALTAPLPQRQDRQIEKGGGVCLV